MLSVDGPVNVEKHLKPPNQGQSDGIVTSRRFKTKTMFLKHLDETLSKGEVLAINQAFALVKSCGGHMVGETNATRNDLVTHVWSELEKNGVILETGMWNTLLSVYIENNYEFEPLDFLKDMWQKSNSEPSKTTFSLLIQAYAARGDPVGAMKIVEFMMQNDGKMTEHIYGWLVQAFAKNGDMDGVNEILRSMRKNNLQPRHTTYSHLINAHAEQGDLASIDKTIQEMIEQKFYPTSLIYIGLLDHLSIGGHSNLIEKVWERIDDIEYINEDIRPLIQRCVTRGDYESAMILLKRSNKRVSKSKQNYDKFIERKLFQMLKFAEKDINEYMKVLSLMEQNLDQAQFSRVANLMEFLVYGNKIETAFNLLESLLSEGKPVTVQMFHPILQGHADKKNISEIVKVYEFMIDKDIKLDYYCYKIVIPALGEVGSDEYQLFLELIKNNDKIVLPNGVTSEVLKSDGIALNQLNNAVTSASLVDLFGSLKEIKNSLLSGFNPVDAIDVVCLLHKRGLRDVSVIIDEIMTHLISQDNRAEDALDFLKGMIEKDMPISSNSYTKMLKVLHQYGMADHFFMFVRLMKERGVDPDVHQYYQMLKMAAKVGNSMAAQFCFEKVIISDNFPHRKNELYEYLITAYSKDTENVKIIPTYIQERDSENAMKVVHLFDEMIEKGHTPSEEIITTVIKSYLLARDIEGANKLIEKYGEGKASHSKIVKNSFMRAYVARKEFNEAEELFDQMKTESIVTQLQYNEMMRICEFTGDVKKMEQLHQEMLENGFVPNVFTYLHRIRTYLMAKEPEPCIAIIEENLASEKNLLRVDIYMIVLRHLVPTGNIENVKKVIELIKEHHISRVPPKRLMHALTLVNIKAGNLEEASGLLPQPSEDPELTVDIELNPYRKAAKSACMDGDVKYIENIIQFLKMNNLHYQSLDTFYLLALNKNDDIDGIQRFYRERMDEGVSFNEKFVDLLESIIEDRGLNNFKVKK